MPRVIKRVSDKIVQQTRDAISGDRPHFHIGGREQWFPKARVILLRNNAKHTPYQAKFIVPKSFNKLDLRDYLYNIYGLRAMNITTQLLHSRTIRPAGNVGRFRGPQIKKMTIEMLEPFVWPEEPTVEDGNDQWNTEVIKQINDFSREINEQIRSDKRKPIKAFGGVLLNPSDPARGGIEPFIPVKLKRYMLNTIKKDKERRAFVDNLSEIQRAIEKI